jgi:uncharacterized protein (DUF433 family)
MAADARLRTRPPCSLVSCHARPRDAIITSTAGRIGLAQKKSFMLDKTAERIFGSGVYGATEGLRLINFHRGASGDERKRISRSTLLRWLQGYDFEVGGETRHSPPLWTPDYPAHEGEPIELSFRDLIELRFVKAFRDAGMGLTAIRECFSRAVKEVQDERPFSTRRFRTDGKTIFLEIMRDLPEDELIDLRKGQRVFQSFIAPSLHGLEFDAEIVARWFPLGESRRSILIDPARSFGRPLIADGGVPTQVIAAAVKAEGEPDRVAKLYQVSLRSVKDAVSFEEKLAA